MQSVTIVGAGLVGCLAATILARRSIETTIYEKAADPDATSVSAQRSSINLTLCQRGITALQRAGLATATLAVATPARGRVVHALDGRVHYQPYGRADQAIYSIRRSDLNRVVRRAALRAGVRIEFGAACVDIDAEKRTIACERSTGVGWSSPTAAVIVADGARSQARSALDRQGRLRASMTRSASGYKVMQLTPARHLPGWQAEAIHVWPRGEHMAIAFPNRDGSYSVAVHLPFAGQLSFEQLNDAARLGTFLQREYPDLYQQLDAPEAALLQQRATATVTVQCAPWHASPGVLVLGDASHAILPHYGQGANAGFEDCAVLETLLARHGPDLPTVFAQFEQRRRPDIEAIAALSAEHARELHDTVATADYERRLQIEQRLHERLPQQVLPLYSMIAFSDLPYADVRARELVQRRIIERLMTEPSWERALDCPATVEAIAEEAGQAPVRTMGGQR